MKRDGHTRKVEERMGRSTHYRAAFQKTLQQIDLALLVREMRDGAGLTQTGWPSVLEPRSRLSPG